MRRRLCAATAAVALGILGWAAPEATATFSFSSSVGSPFAVGDGPGEAAIGDFNGDAKPDLATTNQIAGTVTVLLGNGTGGFTTTPGSPFTTGAEPTSIAIDDLNGDLKPDIVTSNRGSDTVTVLLGNGSGGFTAAPGSPFAAGDGAGSVAVGDLSGDGKPDLAVANRFADTVAVLLGNGSGGFTAAPGSPITVGDFPFSIAIGDFNGDVRPDLVTADFGSDNVTVLSGNGSGGFTAVPGSPLAAGDGPNSVAVGDLNRDTRADLVIANFGSGNVTVLLGNGSGGFAAAPGSPFAAGALPQSVAIGDLNGDAQADLAVVNFDTSNNVNVLLGNGSGGFAAPAGSPFAAGSFPSSVAVGDLNGDVKADVTVANFGSDNISVLLNTSSAARNVGPGSLALGSQPVGTLSPSQSVTITSTGDAALRVSRAFTGGADASEFAIVRDRCTGVAVAVGSSCTIQVSFAPSSAGAKASSLEITDNTGAVASVSLTGSGGAFPAGPQGQTGPQGLPGPTGPQGPTGTVGSAGPAGAAGATGATGTAGARGPTGAAGPRGLPGSQGAAGAPSPVACKVRRLKGAKKIKVTCRVKTAAAVTASLRRGGRTVARRRVVAGSRTLVFQVRARGHGAFRLRLR